MSKFSSCPKPLVKRLIPTLGITVVLGLGTAACGLPGELGAADVAAPTPTTTKPGANAPAARPTPTTTTPGANAPAARPAPPTTPPAPTSSDAYGPARGLPARTRYTGPSVITTPGTVVANVDISGPISIAADNVTLSNVSVVATTASAKATLVSWGASKNFTAKDVRVNGMVHGVPGAYQAFGGWGIGATITRCEATGAANGVEFGGSGVVQGCYLHDLWQMPGTTQHADGIQVDGGGPYAIRNNYVDMGTPPAGLWSQTSAIGAWADLNHLRDTRVEHNVIGPNGGFLFYNGVVDGFTASNVAFNGNVILRRPIGGEYGVWYSGSYAAKGTRSGNVYADGTSAD